MSTGCMIYALADKIAYTDPHRDIGPLDYIRWATERVGDWVFINGFVGSATEDRMILNGDIPWSVTDDETKARLHRDYPDYFEEE